ncbi:MAG: NAD(P)/FAD-dependent oxidoreductase [Candidatus Melainabacteria bacterium]|nr:NAD(P)/FAD-dependent oxidoreductase [Candidatus Melainabacteria bacterium]
MQVFDVIIIGAGGAGMMCAIHAVRRGRRIALLDHSQKIGRKILISGGGRCNFTNINAGPANYVCKNEHFAKSALSRYTPDDFIEMVERHRISYHEKKLGQLFCDGSAQNIVTMLVDECKKTQAEIFMDCSILSVSKKESFVIRTSRGDFGCGSLVIATGGLSIPQIGATGFGYDIAKQFGLKLVKTDPALDGFNFAKPDLAIWGELSGASLDVNATCGDASFRENILFTHNGLSGPASLQTSLYWQTGRPLIIDLMPDLDAYEFLLSVKKEGSKVDIKNVLATKLTKRFAEKFAQVNKIQGPINTLNEPQLKKLAQVLNSWQIYPSSTVGYRKAEVTRGGVDTDELSSKTMEAKKVPGLYFIGEVVDVTGWLGGYNFQWAWASGHACGISC